jgi:hypothetical protein
MRVYLRLFATSILPIASIHWAVNPNFHLVYLPPFPPCLGRYSNSWVPPACWHTLTADDRKETGPAKYSLILLLVSDITLFLSSIFMVSSIILPNAGAHSTYMFRWWIMPPSSSTNNTLSKSSACERYRWRKAQARYGCIVEQSIGPF